MPAFRFNPRLCPSAVWQQQQPRCFAQTGLREISHSTRMQSQSPIFASGVDESNLQSLLNNLVRPNGHWDISASGRGIERTYRFKTFKAAWNFMSNVAEQCKSARHHPEWSNVYNSVFVRWTTHNPPGLTNKDAEMAGFCDRLASKGESGDAGSTAQEKDSEKLKDLADDVATGSGDCCGKPEKEQARQEEKERIEKEEGDSGKEGSVAGIGGQPS